MVTVFTVATGAYLGLWKAQASSADRHLFPGHELSLVVFTDHPDDVADHGRALVRAHVTPVRVPSYGWPHATLQRYQLITDFSNMASDGVCLHLDADMVVVRNTGSELRPEEWGSGLALVQHPGFYRANRPWLSGAGRAPRSLLSDVRGFLRGEGGIGQWERRPESTAYVPYRLRRTYVCGAVWLGRNQEFLQICRVLAERTRADSERGIIARWHDESHLNWYAAHHGVTILDPSYCHTSQSRILEHLEPRIIAVDKGVNWIRSAGALT